MKDIQILYPKRTYVILGSDFVELNPVVLEKQYQIFDAILDFAASQVDIGGTGLRQALQTVKNIVILLRSIVSIIFPDVNVENVTLPQASHILFIIWLRLVKLMKDAETNAEKDDQNIEYAFSRAVDLICSEYGWHLDYIWKNLTSDQFILLLNRISERKELDLKFYAACHGANVDGQPTKGEEKDMKSAYGKKSIIGADELYGIQDGNTFGLTKLALWIGIPIPDNLNVEKNEPNLRILIRNRLRELDKIKKLPNIDLAIDPIEACYEINAGDIVGIKEKLEELGIGAGATLDAISKAPDPFKAMLMAKFISDMEG